MKEDFVLKLIETFSAQGALSELSYGDETSTLRLIKNVPRIASEPRDKREDDISHTTPHSAESVRPLHESRQPTAPGLETITSPVVATFYAAPNPDSPAFVSVGSRVKKGDALCVLEAMKMMNRLEAEFPCEIAAIHAKNGDLVEFGQPLFDVRRIEA